LFTFATPTESAAARGADFEEDKENEHVMSLSMPQSQCSVHYYSARVPISANSASLPSLEQRWV